MKKIDNHLNETNDKKQSIATYKESFIWWEINLSNNNEVCSPEQLYRVLSNSKQSTANMTNRDWWKANIRRGFMTWKFREASNLTLYLEVKTCVSELDITTRLKKVVGINSSIRMKGLSLPNLDYGIYEVKIFGDYEDDFWKGVIQ
jgi:hypothetical protein